MDDQIGVDRADGVVTLTLNRPDRKNAITSAMWSKLRDTFRDIAEGTDRVVVITGADGDFSSGADLADPRDPDEHPLTRMRLVGDACLALHRLPQPTVAKVDGVAVGAGMNLALSCDLIVASDRARFSEIFARRGLSLDFGGSWLLPRLIGLHKAKELALLGDILDATEVAEMGLVNRVVPAEQLDETTAGLVRRLAAGPPLALGSTKRLLNDAFTATLDEALEAETRAQAVNLSSQDAREAVQAFLDKREPRFHGR